MPLNGTWWPWIFWAGIWEGCIKKELLNIDFFSPGIGHQDKCQKFIYPVEAHPEKVLHQVLVHRKGDRDKETRNFCSFSKKKKNVRLLSRPFKKLLQPVLAQLPHCSPVTLPSQIYSLTHGSDPNTKTTKIMRLSEGNLQVLMPCSGTLLIQNLVVVSLPPEHSPWTFRPGNPGSNSIKLVAPWC